MQDREGAVVRLDRLASDDRHLALLQGGTQVRRGHGQMEERDESLPLEVLVLGGRRPPHLHHHPSAPPPPPRGWGRTGCPAPPRACPSSPRPPAPPPASPSAVGGSLGGPVARAKNTRSLGPQLAFS